MTKVTIDRALIESELKTLAAKGCGKCFAQDCDWPECHPRAKELRAALAQPAVEPVAYRYKYLNFMGDEVWSQDLPRNGKALETQALYTSPPPPAQPARTSQDVCTVPLLSDEEILQLTPLWFKKYTDGVLLSHARAIEQLVRRKAGL